jgi:acetyltransferase-like isoleucine patch superfamily enzyme
MVKTVFKLRLFAYRVWRMFIGRIWYGPFFGSFGSRVVLEPPVLVSGPHNIYVGDRTLIRRGARLETVEVHGRTPRLMIGSNCNIEQNVHLVCHSSLTIGNDVSITANCAIVDVTHPYLPISETKIGMRIADVDSFVKIGDGCFIGIGSMILPNVSLGEGCVVGANSVVTRSFAARSIIAGSPAVLVRNY